MPSNSFTTIVIIGGVALLIGLLGGGVEISNIRLPHLPGWQRALSGLIGTVLIALGLVLDPSVRNPLSGGLGVTPTATLVEVAQLSTLSLESSTEPEIPTLTHTPVPSTTPTNTSVLPTNTTHIPPENTQDLTTTATNIAIPSPSISDLCPDIVSLNTITTWRVGTVEIGQVQQYIAVFDSHRKIGGGFVKGDIIPAGVLIATDFGNGQSEIYQTYPVKPIVHFRSWGLFEVAKSFSAPHEGACITIDTSISPPEPVVGTSDQRDTAAKTVGYRNLDELMKAFEIPIEVKPRVFVCPNEETWCLSVFEEQGQLDFHFNNALSCTLDGKQSNGISIIPPGFDGTVKGFTIRPCPS